MNQIEIVGQRQFGIINPDLDTRGVDGLSTFSLASCFAVSLRDPDSRTDFLTHLDDEGQINLALDSALPVFALLGVKKLDMRTINFYATPKARTLLQIDLIKRRQSMDRFAERLVRLGFARYPRWKDLGAFPDVVIRTGQPIRVGNINEDYLPNVRPGARQRVREYTEKLLEIIVGPGPNEESGKYRVPITAAYIPELG